MVPRKLKTRQTDKAKHRIYLNKASDFYETMIDAFEKENWNSVGLAAVHCVISATDALLTYQSGIRSVSQDHREVAQLLRQHISSEGVAENAKRLLKVIGVKNLVEYEARNFTQKEASTTVKDTERYFEWVKSLLLKE